MVNENESELFRQLENVFDSVDETEFDDLQKLPLKQLLERLSAEDELIKEKQQILSPSTQEGRDAHSRRYAILLELRRRKY